MDNPFPKLEVRGTHNDLGHAIGKTFAPQIHAFVDRLHKTLPEYAVIRHNTQPYLALTKTRFPLIVEEMEAIAKGAGLEFLDIFFANCPELHPYATSPDHCTGIVTKYRESGEFLVGHNEDNPPGASDYLYILDAVVNGVHIVGLSYMPELPGSSAAMNSFGLYQGINTLHPETRVGIPKNVIARAVLSSKTIDEAEKVIRNSKSASGFNHVLVSKDGYLDIAAALDDFEVDRGTKTPYVHTNHYLTEKLQENETYRTNNSVERYQQARATAAEKMTKKELMDALSSCDASKFTQSAWHDTTLAAVIACPARKTTEITNRETGVTKEYSI